MICIIGGANMDIQGFSYDKIIFNDSNPGKVEKGFGGVGRNISENLAHLGCNTTFIAPMGDDSFSNNLLSYMKSKKVNMDNCLILKDKNLSTYLSILNEENEMILAISSMDILESLDIEFLKDKEDMIKSASVLVLDTNLRADVIEYLSKLNDKVLIDLVSTTKALKLGKSISNIHTIKPNKLEAQILTGIEITDIESMKKAASILLDKGVTNVFITLGKQGLFYMNSQKYELLPNPNIVAKDITGAGDAFSAGLAYCLDKGYDISKMARVAMCMSLLNVTNIGTCYQDLDVNKLNETLKKYFDIEL